MGDDPTDRRRTFDKLFAGDPDPWNFVTSAYERDKRDATIAALRGKRFSRALEVGCATGVLTRALASQCEAMLALDVSDRALVIARGHSAADHAISYRRVEVPREWPEGFFDLIVFSEILYFLSADEIAAVSRLARDALSPNGLCLLVNWTGPNDLPVDGMRAADLFIESALWRGAEPVVAPTYRIDLIGL